LATNRTHFDASPERIYALLMQPAIYPKWVVGARKIRAVDPDWPKPGSRFHHQVLAGLVPINDNTKLVEAVPDRKVVLHARARPTGVAEVVITLTPRDGGTDFEIREYPISGFAKRIDNPVLDGLIYLRNVEALRRLRKVIAGRKATARWRRPAWQG
jgi:uncharacterized protein YndB with AHSA1/START domain